MTTEQLTTELDRQRVAASELLARISSEFGPDSRLARQGELAWAESHRAAVASVLHDDYANAVGILRDVVQGLDRSAEAARRGELPQADIAALLRGAR